MSEVEPEEEAPRVRRRRWPRLLAGLGLIVALAVGLAWYQRVQIAEGFLARELARRGVPARYVVTRIGFFTQRIERVSIGDPARPDLTADWIEVQTALGFGGPVVTGVRAGPLRMRGRLAGGKLSLGAIDRLMPAPSGKPFVLPALNVDLTDARMALETPQGNVALSLTGRGALDNGFAGRLRASAPTLDLGACTVRGATADVAIRTVGGRPLPRGPARAEALRCGEAGARSLVVDLSGVALDRNLTLQRADLRVGLRALAAGGATIRDAGGTVSLRGERDGYRAVLALRGAQARHEAGSASGLALRGEAQLAKASEFAATLSAERATLAPATIAAIPRLGDGARGTPVAPLAAQLARALASASRAMTGEVAFSGTMESGRGMLRVSRVDLSAPTGARVALRGGDGIRYNWPDGGLAVGGMVTTRGGGLPEAAIELSQASPGGPISGVALVEPYAAGGARLALAAVRFRAAPGGATQVSTRATLSGPLSGGRVDGLELPIDARWTGDTLVVNRGCAPLVFERLHVSSLVLDRSRLNLCPMRDALLTVRRGAVSGGAKLGGFRLGGRIGSAPLHLAGASGSFDFGTQRFALAGVATRIGAESVTRLDVARLDGRIAGDGGIAGSFAGAGGQIGQVPLVLGEAAGQWRLAGGRLTLDGGLKVADSAEAPRFNPLIGDSVRLTLADSRIEASGVLREPKGGVKVADVTLSHDLAKGSGSALLDVPGIAFAEGGLQPSDLTPLTFGVVAGVKGKVSGQGRIAWDQAGVTSDGVFRTAGTDLAAAFGPVTGLSTEIRFSDLLGMRTEPGQVATVAVINPGIPVENGTIRYRLLDSTHVAIEGGRWPFAGGELTLEPTLLDFSTAQERRLTFRLTGVDAAQFLQEMEFANLNATGTFDGVLPIVFDAKGGRIEGGHLKARNGGSIAYKGEVTKRDVGVWGNLAFQALRSLNYRSLDLEMNGSLAGDMVTEIRFAGVSQGEGAKSNFLIRRLQRLPFVFNVTIRAPFRQLLESVQSYYDPSRLIQRNLPALIEEQERQQRELREKQNIQPSESETVP